MKIKYTNRKRFDPSNMLDVHRLVKFLNPLQEQAKDDRTIIKALTEEYRSSSLFLVIKVAERIIYG